MQTNATASAAKKLDRTYSSWKDAYEDYLAGYCRWAGLSTSDVWSTERGRLYQTMLADSDEELVKRLAGK